MKLISTLVLLSALFFSVPSLHAEKKIVIDGSTTVGPVAKAFAEYYKTIAPSVNITISESGSGNGAKSLINGSCDIANMSRFMKGKEFKAAAEKGIKPVAHVVALDGIAIAVHPANPVTNITMDQLKDIYLGKIRSWKKLGGPDIPVIFITRDSNSGTFETFHKLVMKKQKINGKAEVVGSNGAARGRIQSTRGAIGYLGLGFVDRKVKALSVNKVVPSNRTIANGSYPIARPLFMFTNGYPKMGTDVYRFVTIHLSKKGQEIIKRIGFIPVTEY